MFFFPFKKKKTPHPYQGAFPFQSRQQLRRGHSLHMLQLPAKVREEIQTSFSPNLTQVSGPLIHGLLWVQIGFFFQTRNSTLVDTGTKHVHIVFELKKIIPPPKKTNPTFPYTMLFARRFLISSKREHLHGRGVERKGRGKKTRAGSTRNSTSFILLSLWATPMANTCKRLP